MFQPDFRNLRPSSGSSLWKGKKRNMQLYGAVLKTKQIELFFQVSWTLVHLYKPEIVLRGSDL